MLRKRAFNLPEAALERITSATNERVKTLVRLMKSRSFREEAGLFLVEGATLAREAALSDYAVDCVYYTERALESYRDSVEAALAKAKGDCFEITDGIAEKVSGQPSPQGIFTVLRMRPELPFKEMLFKKRILMLETIQNPDNLGAMARSALAFGFDAVALSSDCADWRSPKAQRAAMGALLKMEAAVIDDVTEAIVSLQRGGFTVYAAAMRSDSIALDRSLAKDRTAVVIGNEAGGLKEETIAACDASAIIPIDGRMESLNAAVAASIFMWELRDDG